MGRSESVIAGKVSNVISETREKLAFSQPFPLHRSHQPTFSTFWIPSAHLSAGQAAERKSKATSTNPSQREKCQTSPRKNKAFPSLFRFFDPISPSCSQPGLHFGICNLSSLTRSPLLSAGVGGFVEIFLHHGPSNTTAMK